ncbi:MAG: TIGR02757 family protein [Sulfurimonadaceae bacterium]
MQNIKALLDAEVQKRNSLEEICEERLDPIIVAHRYRDERVALVCALFAYGNVKQIVKFLESLDFSLFDGDEVRVQKALACRYYRFQKGEDIVALFIALGRLHAKGLTLEEVFQKGYMPRKDPIEGINELIRTLGALYPHATAGYTFLLSQVTNKTKGAGALKRWMMFLRWMVRKDCIDMGLWHGVNPADLIIPLDTHTFNVSRKLGLLSRKSYDLEAAIELTNTLKTFDAADPLKYDFALYRLGQERLV